MVEHPIRAWVAFGAAVGLAVAIGVAACSNAGTTGGTGGTPCFLPCGDTCCNYGTCVDGQCCDSPCGETCCTSASPCCLTPLDGGAEYCGANDCGEVCCGGPGAKAFCPDPTSAEPMQCVESCRSSADCNGYCCALRDPARGLGVCTGHAPGSPGAGGSGAGGGGTGGSDAGAPDAGGSDAGADAAAAGETCLCYQNSDCVGATGCCQPLLDDQGVPTGPLACASMTSQPGQYQCCEWGFTTCAGSNCCVGIGQVNFCAPSCGGGQGCGGARCQPASVPTLDFGCNSSTLFCGP